MFVFICFVVYFITSVVVGRRYYARRHGVLISPGAAGSVTAAYIGFAWPVTIWMEAVREPSLCGHHQHVLRRNQLRAEIEMVEQLRREEGQ
jgi:hypothetical protein